MVYGEEGNLSIGYAQLTPYLVKAVKSNRREIESYRIRLESLKEKSENFRKKD